MTLPTGLRQRLQWCHSGCCGLGFGHFGGIHISPLFSLLIIDMSLRFVRKQVCFYPWRLIFAQSNELLVLIIIVLARVREYQQGLNIGVGKRQAL
ncbi:MAG: hypothetical protein VB032_05325 [Burkholderiaceae bacterium]|nr:hypothetical protein [Burkholderiaceae bacterium]